MVMRKLVLLLGFIFFVGCVDQSEDVSIMPREEVVEIFEDNVSAEVISVDFQTHNGFLKVHLWDKQSYRVEVTKWARATTSQDAQEIAEDMEVDFSESEEGEGVVLQLETQERIAAGADVTAYLPGVVFESVDLSTFNGGLQIDEITAADVSLVTANGDIRGYVTADTIRVKTSHGKIQGVYRGNYVTLETTNGRIDVECGDYGEYDAETTNGDIDVVVDSDFKFNLKTTLGDIVVEADPTVYIIDERDHKKGYTDEEYTVIITASTTVSSITVVKK